MGVKKSVAFHLRDIFSTSNLLQSFNSLTAIDGHDRQYFNELRARVVSP